MVNEYEPWKEHGETEVEYLRRTYLEESKTYYEDGFTAGLEHAAEICEERHEGEDERGEFVTYRGNLQSAIREEKT